MSFFDDIKNFGIVALVLAVISLVYAIYGMVTGISSGYAWMGYIGELVFAILLGLIGFSVINGVISDKLVVLGKITFVIGIVSIVEAIVLAVISIVSGAVIPWMLVISSVVIGVLAFLAASSILNGKATFADKIIWIFLLIIFALSLLGAVSALFASFAVVGSSLLVGIITLIYSLAMLFFYIFLLVSLFSDDVKSGMGM